MLERTRRNNSSSRYVSIDELQQHVSVGRYSAKQIAKDAKAVIRIGRRVVYDLARIDAYMETLAG